MRLPALLTLIACSPVLAQSSVLPNGNFDASVSGWTYSGPATGSITWEPADGSPNAGSLRLSTSLFVVGGGPFTARSLGCAIVAPSDRWTAEAVVKPEPGLSGPECTMQILVFSETDCTGIETEVEPRAGGVSPGTWTPAAQWSIPAWEAGNSISVRLLLEPHPPGGGTASCLFDSVRLYRSPSGVEIPAASSVGLALLALLVAMAGVAMLRR